MVSANLSYVDDEYKLSYVHMVSTNLCYVHGEYKLILRTWRVQIYITYIVSANLI